MDFVYWLYVSSEKYKVWIIALLWILFWGLGFFIYYHIYGLDILSSSGYALEQFAVSVKTPFEVKDLIVYENNSSIIELFDIEKSKSIKICERCGFNHKEDWHYIYLVAIGAKLTLFLSIFLLFFREQLSWVYRNLMMMRGNHTVVIGLGRNSRFFINSLLLNRENRHKIMVFEIDKSNTYLGRYRDKPIVVLTKNIESMLNKLFINKCKNLFISTGDDEQNIYLALQLLSQLKPKHRMEKLLLHIENRTLRNLYSDKGILRSKNVDIRLFSYYKDAARLLFQNHPLDGDGLDIIKSKKEFHIVVVGNTELGISIVTEACRLAHFPNDNRLIIYCIDADVKSFESHLYYAFPEIKKIENISIKFLELKSDTLSFYNHQVWKSSNLKHIMFCYDNVGENISIVTKLKNLTYLRDRKRFESIKFHVAMMNHIKMAKKLKEDNQNQKNIFSFAEANYVCSGENLLRNEIDKIAEMIHHAYEKKELSNEEMKEAWKKVSINDKRSSVGQAIHLATKLKIMNLKRVKFKYLNWSYSKILEYNQDVFLSVIQNDLKQLGLSEEYLNELKEVYQEKDKDIQKKYYFPQEYELLFEKMLRMEHNRWMSVLLLMDNQYSASAKDISREERKELKIHYLLKSFSKFKTRYEKIHIINDMNAILNIPEYMSKLGYLLVIKDKDIN